MVWLEIGKKIGQQWEKVIMVDGYAPGIDYYRKMDLSSLYRLSGEHYIGKTLPTLLKRQHISEKEEIRIFTRLIRILRDIHCPLSKNIPLCYYRYYTSGNNPYSLEKKFGLLPAATTYAGILKEEYKHDRDEGKKRYIQNIIRTPLPDIDPYGTPIDIGYNRCLGIEECISIWLKELNFKVKKEDEYRISMKHHRNFATAWYHILQCELR